MKKLLLILLCLPILTLAQHNKTIIDASIAQTKKLDINPVKSEILTQVLSSEVINDETAIKWNRSLINFEKKHKLSSEVQEIIDEKTNQKLNNLKKYYSGEEDKDGMKSNPTIGTNFEGNWFDGATPPDNSMAISNGGYIVTTCNSSIEYYNTSGTYLYGSSFDDFFNDASLTSMIYDPVVLYDSGSDRFFMVVLHGSSPSTSKVLTCFSKTNNPQDGWWIYQLTGNPTSSNNWFDYPKVGVSNNEVYITGNLFDASDNFAETVIYQIDKNDGYSGASLTWLYWVNISEDPFTLVPASYGIQGNYGPGIYFVSTDENGTLTEKYRLYDLTDDISGSPQLTPYSIDADFSLAGNALQNGTSVVLSNGGNRGLKAFYLNGIVHFVFNSEYINAYNGINYNRLTVSSLSNWNSIFGLDGYDYSYPSVASFGTSTSDKSAMICFLRSSASIFPEVRVVGCDNSGYWTSSSLVKAGETYVDVYASNGVTRWGDYTGISRKQNASSPEVWVSGGFGKYRLSEHAFDTWIAQVNGIATGVTENPNPIDNKMNVYPNPVFDMFSVEFTIENKTKVSIELIDISGKVVKVLYNDAAKKGQNMFSFNKGALASGVYFLTIKTDSNILRNEKVIVE
tara:strand:+ start:135 stop:2009 length:1875 start_codon:yes stop_codon:yes gene_type:complete